MRQKPSSEVENSTRRSPLKSGSASKPVRQLELEVVISQRRSGSLKGKNAPTFADTSGVPRMSQELNKYYYI